TVGLLNFNPLQVFFTDFADTLTTTTKGYEASGHNSFRTKEITFDTHALVQGLEADNFDKAQAEIVISALTTLSNVSLDTIYKEMVTQAQQEITIQQLMTHLDSIRKEMKKTLWKQPVTQKDTKTRSISETWNKIDTEIAAFKALMESNQLETICDPAASVFTCLAIELGLYRFWK
ncbi:Coiled-coil domain-containing protein 90B, mitochondrial, partial [Galemys pyrenaicus]